MDDKSPKLDKVDDCEPGLKSQKVEELPVCWLTVVTKVIRRENWL